MIVTPWGRGRTGHLASRLCLPEIALRSYSVAAAASSTCFRHLPSRHAPARLIRGPRIARHELAALNHSDRFQADRVGRLRRSARWPARPRRTNVSKSLDQALVRAPTSRVHEDLFHKKVLEHPSVHHLHDLVRRMPCRDIQPLAEHSAGGDGRGIDG
jgi:hypothetical protein